MRHKDIVFASVDFPPCIKPGCLVFLDYHPDHFLTGQAVDISRASTQFSHAHLLSHRQSGFGIPVSFKQTFFVGLCSGRKDEHEPHIGVTREIAQHHDPLALFCVRRVIKIGAIDAETRNSRNLVSRIGIELVDKLDEFVYPIRNIIFIAEIEADSLAVDECFDSYAFITITLYFHAAGTCSLGNLATVNENLSNNAFVRSDFLNRFEILASAGAIRLCADVCLPFSKAGLKFFD